MKPDPRRGSTKILFYHQLVKKRFLNNCIENYFQEGKMDSKKMLAEFFGTF